MEKEFGARLGRSIAKACTSGASVQPGPAVTKASVNIPVEKIVRENVYKCEREEMAMARAAQKAVYSYTVLSANFGANIATQILASIRNDVENLEEKALRPYKIVLEMADMTREAMNKKNVQCLSQDMVEQCVLLDLYCSKVQELKSKLKDKEAAMEEIKLTMEHSNVNRAVPDIALKIAAIMENKEDDSGALASLLKKLIQNRGTPVKRWSESTKFLFAIILDYGGPALAKIVQEKIGRPSLQTMYCTAKCNYAIPNKLEEQALKGARSFYNKIGYDGVFALAVDATAVIPTLRVKGNKIIGLATEQEITVTSAQDILNVVKNKEHDLAKQANAFILAPLQDHILPFVLAVGPVFKGQDHTLVRHWCNQVILWGARNKITILGLGADGDS